jgi:hypothetical protein
MDPLPFLDQILTFPDGTSYQRLEPITDFRQCHGVTPPERRILFRCRRIASSEGASSTPENPSNESKEDDECILKIKVQIPDDPSTTTTANNGQTSPNPTTSIPPPSTPTSHELKALTIFRDSQTPSGPHLIAFSHFPQPASASSPMPLEGYISCTVMSKIAGKSLFDLGYWSLASPEREEMQRGFLEALG